VEAEDQVCGGRLTARRGTMVRPFSTSSLASRRAEELHLSFVPPSHLSSLSLSLSWSPTQGKGEEEAAAQPSRASSTVAWATR
jgi:hypothetical protein